MIGTNEIIIIVLLILTVVSIVIAITEHNKAKVRIEYNLDNKIKNDELAQKSDILTHNLEILKEKEQHIKEDMDTSLNTLNNIKNATNEALDSQKEVAQKAFESYCDVLSKQYDEKSTEFDEMSEQLNNAYAELQDKILAEIETQKAELAKIRATRTALIQAQVKEKEIKENKDFYCLIPTENDKDDIRRLDRIKHDLHNPRILSMLIWQTFFQKQMTTLCNNVLGTKTITGIYKITNLNNDLCYIGQAVDMADRWKQHAKCGLGIDTPQGNKLYNAMMEDGLWNFSWELLEECPKEQLDGKEKYYISIYQSCDFGYNSNKGNGGKK